MSEFNDAVVAEFRANNGKVGGTFEGAPMLLLHTTGARSGKERISPLMYLADGDRYVIFASKAGAPSSPDWYWNLRAEPRASIEVDDRTIDVVAEELAEPERTEKYGVQAERYPGFADYQRKTDRVIPVVALTPAQH